MCVQVIQCCSWNMLELLGTSQNCECLKEKMVVENVSHAPVYPAIGPSAELAKDRLTKPWYGSPSILKKWLPWLIEYPENKY